MGVVVFLRSEGKVLVEGDVWVEKGGSEGVVKERFGGECFRGGNSKGISESVFGGEEN